MKNVIYIYDTAIEEFFKDSLEECRKTLNFLYGGEVNLVRAGLKFNDKKAGFLCSLSVVAMLSLQADLIVIGDFTETWSDFFKNITNVFKFFCPAKSKEDLNKLVNKKRDLEALGMLKVKDELCEGFGGVGRND